MLINEYDGFYFLPGDEDYELNLAYFKVNEETDIGTPIEYNDLGSKYHIAFFKTGEDGHPEFDEEFEAVFADPSVYIKNMIGMDIFGCVLRKTEHSQSWWKDYLDKAKEQCRLLRVKHVIQALTELKDAKT